MVMPQGAASMDRLIAIVQDPDSGLPAAAVAASTVLVVALSRLDAEIGRLDGSCGAIRLQGDVPLSPTGSFQAFDLGHSQTWAAVHD